MTFKWFKASSPLMDTAYFIRDEVFTKEQGFSAADDIDGMDEKSEQVLGFDDNGNAVCTARMFIDRPGVYHAGRVSVLKSQRGTGLGRVLIDEVCKKAKQLGANRVELGAQLDKAGFYYACGFEKCGEEFMDAHCPHVPVGKDL